MESTSPRARILVVDDEPAVRDLLAGFLQLEGYQVCVAADGTEALTELRAGHFDLVIADLLMPVMGGLALLDEMARICPETWMIAMTGYNTLQTAVEALRRGAFDYVEKPFRLEVMNRAVQRAIERPRTPCARQKVLN